jgi:molecular chaperone DnaK
MIQDAGEKLPAAEREAVQQAVDELKKAISANDIGPITRAMEELTRTQHKAAEALYRSQAGAAPGTGPSQPGAETAGQSGQTPPKDEVIDAEVVDDK